MISLLLWILVFLPFILLLETDSSVRKYILSGKMFFAFSHEFKIKPQTAVFLMLWVLSIPLSLGALAIILIRST